MSPPTDPLAKLKALCEAATPGPWKRVLDEPFSPRLKPAGNRYSVPGIKLWEDDADPPGGDLNVEVRANATFIAAANPAVVLALVRALQAADRLADAVAERPIHTKGRPPVLTKEEAWLGAMFTAYKGARAAIDRALGGES